MFEYPKKIDGLVESFVALLMWTIASVQKNNIRHYVDSNRFELFSRVTRLTIIPTGQYV